MPRHAPALECSAEDRVSLLELSKSSTVEAGLRERVRMVLACLEGKQNKQVAEDFEVSVPTVRKWRERFDRPFPWALLYAVSALASMRWTEINKSRLMMIADMTQNGQIARRIEIGRAHV